MKKMAYAIVVLSMFFCAAAFAAEIQGHVQSVDVEKGEILISDSNGASQSVIVHPNVMAALQPGTEVKVSLKEGSRTADMVEVVSG
jgi:hypothetical protein